MSDDRRRPEQYSSRRDEVLRSWIADVVFPYSEPVRAAMRAAGLGRRAVRTAADLARLPVTPLAALGDGRQYVLRPTPEAVAEHGPLTEQVRLRLADSFGRRPELARLRVDTEHRPVLWTTSETAAGTLFVASTTTDLDRLGTLGRRALSAAGVRSDDRVLVLDEAGPGLGPQQLVLGCRDAGVATLHVAAGTADGLLDAAGPTVVAGRLASLRRAIADGLPGSVRLLLRHDGPVTSTEQRETLAGAGLPLAEWWVPPAGRAAWVRCPDGTGYHTWPTHELVEVVDHELVWSAVGWHGSVWLRVGTGERIRLHEDPCPACGRTTPRVEPVPRPAWAAALADADGVGDWLGVRRPDGSVVVLVAPAPDVATDGLRDALAARLGLRVVPVAEARIERARALAGDVDVVDEDVVADALRRARP